MATINGKKDPKVSPKKKAAKKKATVKKKTTAKKTPAKKAKSAQGTTFKSEPGKPEEHTTEWMPAAYADDGYLTANVNVSSGARIGLPDYCDARCGASLTIPCAAVPSEIDKAFDWAKDWVETRVQQMINEINEGNA